MESYDINKFRKFKDDVEKLLQEFTNSSIKITNIDCKPNFFEFNIVIENATEYLSEEIVALSKDLEKPLYDLLDKKYYVTSLELEPTFSIFFDNFS